MRRVKSRTKMVVALFVLLFAALLVDVSLMAVNQVRQTEQGMLEKSRILSVQMSAVWEFMDINQDKIDYDADGDYNFKGIYCSVAGKTIAKFFGRDTDYEINYTDLTPRQPSAAPDDFETRALHAFEDGVEEFYEFEVIGEAAAFRYASPILIEKSCLDCHGSPAGEIDVTGYEKEGMDVGDLAGAMSIEIPIDSDLANLRANITMHLVYFSLVFIAIGVGIFFALTKLYSRPLEKIEATVEQIEVDNLEIDLGELKARDEIGSLAAKVEAMSSKLSVVYEDLESQVAERTVELAEANRILEEQRKSLEEANELLKKESQYKSDFLAMMSHDLRTPLTSIIAFTELWEKAAGPAPGSREALSISEVKLNGQLLLHMVNNTLETARLEDGRTALAPSEIDMAELVETARRQLALIAEKRGVTLSATVDPDVPAVIADRDKLRCVIENLGMNAVKFTEPGGSVGISVSLAASGNEISIKVEDTGCGLRDEDIPLIFERFVQLESDLSGHSQGSGLGLAIVKEYVEMHGGRVQVESVLGEGSTFTVAIPTITREE